MNAPFQFTPQATEDLDAIWWFIAENNETSGHGKQATGHHGIAGALLDPAEIFQLT